MQAESIKDVVQQILEEYHMDDVLTAVEDADYPQSIHVEKDGVVYSQPISYFDSQDDMLAELRILAYGTPYLQ